MKYVAAMACCLSVQVLFAQKTVDVDKVDGIQQNTFYSVNGQPFVNTKFVRLTAGTPYFKDEWMKGTALSATGNGYKSAAIKIDLLDNEVHFLNETGTEMVANAPLSQLILTDTVSGKKYPFVNSAVLPPSAKKGWFLQLAGGKATLYQFFRKDLSENRPFNSAVTEQQINTAEEFYVLLNGTLLQVKKPKDLPAVLPGKEAELNAYLKGDTKKAPVSEKLTEMVTYYNTLNN